MGKQNFNYTFIFLLILFLFINYVVYLIIKKWFQKYEGLSLMNSEFCESHRGNSVKLNESCGKLTENNCNDTSCCVWTSKKKCMAGTATGPTFNSDKNGKTIPLDYYYFENKCYGSKCPNN